MVLVVSSSKPLERTPKGTPRRGVCLQLYAEEIEALYAAEESGSYGTNREFPDRA